MEQIMIILKLAVSLLLMAQGPNVPADVRQNAMDFANQAIVSANAALKLQSQPVASANPIVPQAPPITEIHELIELKINNEWKRDVDVQGGFQYDEGVLQGKIVNMCDINECPPGAVDSKGKTINDMPSISGVNLMIQVGTQTPTYVITDNTGGFSFSLPKDCKNNGLSFPRQTIRIFKDDYNHPIDGFNINRNNINCT